MSKYNKKLLRKQAAKLATRRKNKGYKDEVVEVTTFEGKTFSVRL